MQFWSEPIEKQVNDRVQMVLSDPYLLAAFQRFGADIVRRSSVFHGLDRFLSDSQVRGELAFEIGSWNGLTAAVLSRYFSQVVTVDIVDRPQKYEVLDHLGIKNVTFHLVQTRADKACVWKRSGTFDFAYIDGDHANDTEADFGLVCGCGRVLFHEAWPWQEPVWSLVHQLPREEVTHNGRGLALWRRS